MNFILTTPFLALIFNGFTSLFKQFLYLSIYRVKIVEAFIRIRSDQVKLGIGDYFR